MATCVPLSSAKHRVGQFACIALGSCCTAQGKITFIGQNGQVTIHLGGSRVLTGIPIPRQ